MNSIYFPTPLNLPVIHLYLLILQGGYAGNAAGFGFRSLLDVSATRSNKSGVSLLHYLVAEAYKFNESILSFSQTCLPPLAACER